MPKHENLNVKRTSLVAILLTCILIGILASEVNASTEYDRVKHLLSVANQEMGTALETFRTFQGNIGSEARDSILEDIQSARVSHNDALLELSNGNINSSLLLAANSLFMASRSQYRIYLEIVQLKISEANATIMAVPWYLGKPQYAIEVLNNASTIYLNSLGFFDYYRDKARVDPFDPERAENAADAAESFMTSKNEAIRKLYTNDNSAFRLATKAENLAREYGEEENVVVTRILQISGLVVVAFLITGFAIGTRYGNRVMNYFRNLKMAVRIRHPVAPLTIGHAIRASGQLMVVNASVLVVFGILQSVLQVWGKTFSIVFVSTLIYFLIYPMIVFIFAIGIGLYSTRRANQPGLISSYLCLAVFYAALILEIYALIQVAIVLVALR